CNESNSAATTSTTTPASYRTDCRCSTKQEVRQNTGELGSIYEPLHTPYKSIDVSSMATQ
ncbi:hypothetical protein ACW9HF_36220, partial [Nocardia gipuzkoensis]